MSTPDTPPTPAPKAALTDYLAAERTLLAWIRTGLALMGFGFVVARFGLFLQQLQIMESNLRRAVLRIVPLVRYRPYRARRNRQYLRCQSPSSSRPRTRSRRNIPLPPHHRGRRNHTHPRNGRPRDDHLSHLRPQLNARAARKDPHKHQGDIHDAYPPPATDKGIINISSNHSVDKTVDKLKAILQAKGVTLFALVDHSGEAEKVGLQMPPTKLLIFGSPKAGTPLMLAAPSIAIDLPLKILVWQDTAGKVWISWNSPAYLQQRHGLPEALLQNIAVVETLATKAAE